jgi:hypothetical protein
MVLDQNGVIACIYNNNARKKSYYGRYGIRIKHLEEKFRSYRSFFFILRELRELRILSKTCPKPDLNPILILSYSLFPHYIQNHHKVSIFGHFSCLFHTVGVPHYSLCPLILLYMSLNTIHVPQYYYTCPSIHLITILYPQ